MSDRLHVDDAFPTAASWVLRVDVGGDQGGEDGRSQLEGTLKGGLQADVGGRVGRVRFQFELCVRRVFGKVDQEWRVGRVGKDEEAAVRFAPGCREQSEVGGEYTVFGKGRKEK